MNALRNKKVLLGVGALFCLIGIVAVCSFFPFIMDPSRWQTREFLSDQLIVVAIVIFSTVCLMIIAQASNAMNPKSEIAQARVRFASSVDRIFKGMKISAFSQWVRKRFQPMDIRSARERMVAGVSDDPGVLDLDESQIRALVGKSQKYGDKFYKAITRKQCGKILEAKRRKFHLVDASYYLTCSRGSDDRTLTEQSAGESSKKTALLAWSLGSKLAVTVVGSMIMTSLVYDSSSGIEQATAWMKFLSRMLAMVTSSFMGYVIGCQMNDIDADYIKKKCLVHDRYFEDSEFRPKSQQEEAKEEFMERVREETMKIGMKEEARGGD